MNLHTRRVSFGALCSLVATTALAVIPPAERDALLALFQATNGLSWTDKSGWGGAVGTECDWYGVDCDSENTVTSIGLGGNNLSGFIPPQITGLSNLEALDLGGNEIGGSIPPQLGQLSKLVYLSLFGNPLTGTIPPELGDLGNLTNLDLQETELSGTIPARLGNLVNLEELLAGYNPRLEGAIPPELGRLGKLVYLNLTENSHSGQIPPQLGDLASLELLFLGGNALDGQIPGELTRLPKIRLLYLGGNRLSGPIPPDIVNLTTLEELILDNNLLSGEIPTALNRLTALRVLHLHYNALTGPIPQTLGSLPQLEELLLGNNKLTGVIPVELRQLSKLRYLELYLNSLEGAIPPDLAMLASLETLLLFNNRLSGNIPSQLSQLSQLRDLQVGENLLEGPIPPEFSRLTNLETLSLAGNKLNGTIPDLGTLSKLTGLFLERNQLEGDLPLSLTNLTSLQNLYLYSNRLTGRLPEELQKLTALQQLLLGDNRFNGTFPAALMNLTNLIYLDVNGNQLEGQIPAQIGQLTKLESLGLCCNLLSGPLPAEFGRLTNLIEARLDYNFLSGAVPPLGQLKKLEFLVLNSNEFDALPGDIGEMSSIKYLSLFQNRFQMVLPAELGRLRTLIELDLGANGFRGPIPREITNLTNLADGQSDFSYNALFTTDPVIRDFLNRKQEGRDWESTQTVTPLNVRVSGQTATTVVLSWTRIPYLWDDGGYQVTVSTTPGGTPVKVQATPNKEFSAIVVNELNPQTTYFFVVQTVTYPNDYQKNLLTSDPSQTLQATTTADIASPPIIVVTTFPYGMVQSEGAGADQPSDGYSLSNVGDTPTTITLTQEGSFFTQDPTTFTMEGGEEFYVSLQAITQRPGAYEGASILSGVGVPPGLKVPVYLLSVETPTGTVIAQAATNRIDFAAPESERVLNGTATFSNAGNATLNGILVADVAWLIPQKDPDLVVIPPGQRVEVGFQIDRSLRTEDAETESGTATGTLSLLYLQASSTSGAQLKHRGLQDTTNVSKSVVTIVDTVKPPVAPGELPPLAANEVALLIPGVGNLRGGSGFQFLSDIAVSNAYGADTLRDLRMFFTPENLALASAGTAVDALAPSTAVQLGDVVKSVFNSPDQAGTLQLRTQRPESLTVSANIFNVSNPAGTYGSIIPVFRSDRALKPGERLYLTGLRRTDTSRTNLFLQEAAGQPATVQIEFLDSNGTILVTLNETLQPFRLRRVVNQVPPGGVTARVTNLATSTGRVLAYATPIDGVSGDFWSVADWSQQFASKRTEPVLIPIAGSARGANNTFFRTDADIANVGTTSASGTLRYHPQNAAPIDRNITVEAGQTRTYLDIVGQLFEQASSVGYIVFTPRSGGSFAVTSRTYATVGENPASFGSGVPTVPVDAALRLGQTQVIGGVDIASTATITARKPATFRTNVGLIETTGQPVTVRVTVLYADARAKSYGALTSFEFRLEARQSLLISDLHLRMDAFSRGSDLRNAQLQFDVIAGQGGVILYTSSIDNGTADSSFRLE